MEESVFEKLQKFGLNLYEAKAYASLLKIGTANAYKVSKESGIPRARIYDVLETLTKRGLAMVEESSENTKIYTPVPSKVFLGKTKKEWENDFEDVTNALVGLETEANKQNVYVFTVKGKENITSYCRQLLKGASQYVMISMWNQMYELLLPELEECQNRGCKVLGVGHNLKNSVAQIEIHHDGKYHNMPENLRWFIISADGEKLLYGYSAEMDKDAFYTEDTSHIYLLEDYMIHDMVVNRFVSERENEEELSSMMREILKELGK
ncbi:TrmB family transcriptional regulator [Lachnospiraceae bacterium]|jgi:sugar-specific transcriptional regulator TrmB|nr:TrmB family transcriptional regulator [Lachnospiraceae bacterium]